MSIREAATRVFSNASGSYSSNVNLAVENSSWSDEQQLQEMYLKRKSFAFNSDRCAWMLCHSRASLELSQRREMHVDCTPLRTEPTVALWVAAFCIQVQSVSCITLGALSASVSL